MIRSVAAILVMGTVMLAAITGCVSRDGIDGSEEGMFAARAMAVFTTIRVRGGLDRPCAIVMPGGPLPEHPKTPLAAVVFLHGSGECGTDGVRSCAVGLVPAVVADPKPWSDFVIIVPQKPSSAETWEQHEDYLLACLERACLDFGLDRSRIYLTGLSQGGAGTWAIAARHPELFAAIAPVCGFVHDPAGQVSGKVHVGDSARQVAIAESLVAAKVPVWAFHGEKDDVVPPVETRKLVAAVQAAGGDARATYFPEANHNSWDAAYRDNGAALAAWFLTHKKRVEPTKP